MQVGMALSSLIEKINELQTNAGELTSLEERKHKDQTYYRRVHQRATHFYYHKGGFLAITSQEDLIHAVLDREAAKESPRRDQWLKAGMAKSAASLWIDPRIFEAANRRSVIRTASETERPRTSPPVAEAR